MLQAQSKFTLVATPAIKGKYAPRSACPAISCSLPVLTRQKRVPCSAVAVSDPDIATCADASHAHHSPASPEVAYPHLNSLTNFVVSSHNSNLTQSSSAVNAPKAQHPHLQDGTLGLTGTPQGAPLVKVLWCSLLTLTVSSEACLMCCSLAH